MNILPKDENGIVAMMLRDINNVLRENENFDFGLAAKVKTIKVIFAIADKLDIPITRSWYRHGGYVHNDIINFNPLSRDCQYTIGVNNEEIAKAEQIIKPYQAQYENILHELVPKYFFMSLLDLLTVFYQNAPEIYRSLYFTNLNMEKTFRTLVNPIEKGAQTFQEVISKFGVEKGAVDFGYYTIFTSILSKLSLEMCEIDNFSRMQGYVDQFIDIFEDYLVKAAFLGALSPSVLRYFHKVYEEAIWNPSSLIISLNTVIGTRYVEIKRTQQRRFIAEVSQVNYRLEMLKRQIECSKLSLTLNERTQFFEAMYGKDKEVLGAIADAWKNYKEPCKQ